MKLVKIYVKNINIFLWIIIPVIYLIGTHVSFAQTSVRTGATFQWVEANQPNNNSPATISSITVNGEPFRAFTVPSTYELTRLGPDGHDNNDILDNGALVNGSSADADWNANALLAFQDKNLNHYFTSNLNGRNICDMPGELATTDSQITSLSFDPGIPSNSGGLVAITERNANNCIYLAVYGTPRGGGGDDEILGSVFIQPYGNARFETSVEPPPNNIDYWLSGRVNNTSGSIGIALFVLDELAPIGSFIRRFELTGATRDIGDGKIFILQQYAIPRQEDSCVSQGYSGTVANVSHIPDGSSFTLVPNSLSVPGEFFEFNADGSYSYIPTMGYSGDVTFEYEVCLPAPNESVCDTSTVTISYDASFCCNSSNSDGPSLRN